MTNTPGVYLIHAQVTFDSNKNGHRKVELKNQDLTGGFGSVCTAAAQTGATTLQALSVAVHILAKGYRVRLYALQDSGGALNMKNAYMALTRIK